MLRRLQELLARLYDAQVDQDPHEFLIADRNRLEALIGDQAHHVTDEHVFIVEGTDGLRIGLFIEQGVLDRLERSDPLRALGDDNLQDFCTALEGVSHFHYLLWSIARGRGVSLLELELQAEVDKYVSAVMLLTRQRGGAFPSALHRSLFDQVRFTPQVEQSVRNRYEEANRHAARYCRELDERYLRRRQSRPEAWVQELRRFFRCGHQQKLLAATR